MRHFADTERRIYLVLEDTAQHLTGQDLLRIIEAAEQAHAIVKIRYGSWQVLVCVPELKHQKAERALQAMGYEACILSGEIYERSTFVLTGRVTGHTIGMRDVAA